MVKTRHFHAHEMARVDSLNGLPLATFLQRWLGFWIDTFLAMLVWAPLEFVWRHYVLHERNIYLRWNFHEISNLVVMVLYFGLANYLGNGQTPGKWVARTRAVSLLHERMGLWQSVERSLGYGAALLEGGLGFIQYFWDRNRQCAQDRLAETIVVDVRRKAARLSAPSEDPEE